VWRDLRLGVEAMSGVIPTGPKLQAYLIWGNVRLRMATGKLALIHTNGRVHAQIIQPWVKWQWLRAWRIANMIQRFLIVVAAVILLACHKVPPDLPPELKFCIQFTDGSKKEVVAIGCQPNQTVFTASTFWECSKAEPDGGGFWHRKIIAVYPISAIKSIEEVAK
jgi:hypothetical protein